MKLVGLLLVVLGLVGCAGSQPVFDQKTPGTPVALTPPSTAPAPRKVFNGKDWQLSVEDDGWRRGTSDSAVLALLNFTARTVAVLERKPGMASLEDYSLAIEAELNPALTWSKEEALVAGYPGYKYTLHSRRSQIWGWMVVANGKGYLLTCGTALSLAETNLEMCEDIAKHLVIVKAAP